MEELALDVCINLYMPTHTHIPVYCLVWSAESQEASVSLVSIKRTEHPGHGF